jgi:hypothetical protein
LQQQQTPFKVKFFKQMEKVFLSEQNKQSMQTRKGEMFEADFYQKGESLFFAFLYFKIFFLKRE